MYTDTFELNGETW